MTLRIQLRDDHYRDFHVHESLLCRASPVFQTALQGQFEEAVLKTIDVQDTLFTTLDDFVFWLYRGKLPQFRNLMQHARLNSFAEKYDVATLKYDAAVRAVDRVNHWIFHCFWPQACPHLREIYSNTRPGDYFRTLFVAIYVYKVEPEHFKTVNSAQYFEQYPEFAVEVASAMGRRLAGPAQINFDASMFVKPDSTSSSQGNTKPCTCLETRSDVTMGADQ